MQFRTLVFLISAAAAALFVPAAVAADDNPRGWHLADTMTPAERAVALKVMAILEDECPALAGTNWDKVPPYGQDAEKRIVPFAPTYPKPNAAWGGPAIEGWSVEFPLILHSPSSLETVAITAGGPHNAGLAVRVGGKYLGDKTCALTDDRPGGYKYRAVPALAAPLSILAK